MSKLLTTLLAFAFAATAFAQGTTPAAKPAEPMKATEPMKSDAMKPAPMKAEAVKPTTADTAKPADAMKPAPTTAKKKTHKKKSKSTKSTVPATTADKPAK